MIKNIRRLSGGLLRWISLLGVLAINALLVTLFVETCVRGDLVNTIHWSSLNTQRLFAMVSMVFSISFVLVMCLGSASKALLCANSLLMLLGVIQYYIQMLRGDPFVFSDIFLFREAVSIAGNYASSMSVPKIMVISIAVASASVLSSIGMRVPLRGWKRFAGVLLSGLLLFGCGHYFLQTAAISNVKTISIMYEEAGFLLGFANTIPTKYSTAAGNMKKPADYSREKVHTVLEKHAGKDGVPEMLPDVLFIMSEGLFDLSDYVDMSADPLAELQRLQGEYWGGTFISPTYGNGTARAEYEVLTGYWQGDVQGVSFNNRSIILPGMQTLVTEFEELGYATHAMHANHADFFNRGFAYDAIGFDTAAFSDSLDKPEYTVTDYPSDEYFFGQIIKAYEARDVEKPWMCHTVTYQNHSPFTCKTPRHIRVDCGNVTKEQKESAEAYVNALDVSMDELVKLLDYFDQQERPMLIVFWGDHSPNMSMFGIKDAVDSVSLAKRYMTPLLIWNNYGLDIGEELPDSIAGYRLGAYVMRLLGVTGDAYLNYLSSEDAVNLFDSAKGVIEKDGELFVDQQLYDQTAETMYMLHYDRLLGENYGGECR